MYFCTRNFKQKLDMQIKTAQTKEDFLKCFDVMQALRPHLNPQLFLDLLQKMQVENYTLIYIEEDNKVSGFFKLKR